MQPWSWTPIILGNLGNLLRSSKPLLWNVDNKSCRNRVMRDFKEIIPHSADNNAWHVLNIQSTQICQQLLTKQRLRALVPSSQGLAFWLSIDGEGGTGGRGLMDTSLLALGAGVPSCSAWALCSCLKFHATFDPCPEQSPFISGCCRESCFCSFAEKNGSWWQSWLFIIFQIYKISMLWKNTIKNFISVVASGFQC